MPTDVRQEFHQKLEGLKDDLTRLGRLVDEAVARAMEALEGGDLELAQEVVHGDGEINRQRYYIEEHSTTLIATQQPTAVDLRTIVAAMYVATDFERMGDYAAGIARLVLRLAETGDGTPVTLPPQLRRMAEIGRQMLEGVMEALGRRDAEIARSVAGRDDEIDELNQQIYRELIQEMIKNPEDIRRPTFLLWVAHNLERIGDRVTNVCERVIYMATGEIVEFVDHQPDSDLGVAVYSH
jgi:phosphate transport system protein